MNETATLPCPYCGQDCTLQIDTSLAWQEFWTDCEVCCRPFRVTVECEPGEILSLDAAAE